MQKLHVETSVAVDLSKAASEGPLVVMGETIPEDHPTLVAIDEKLNGPETGEKLVGSPHSIIYWPGQDYPDREKWLARRNTQPSRRARLLWNSSRDGTAKAPPQPDRTERKRLKRERLARFKAALTK